MEKQSNPSGRFHVITHLCWVIAVLLGIIAYVLLNIPNGQLVNDFISFASSLASLVLAVVAIFYSIISNDNISASLTSLRSLGDDVESQAKRLDDAAERFVTTIEEFTPKVIAIPESIRSMEDRVYDKLGSIPSNNEQGNNEEGSTSDHDFFNKRSTTGIDISIYVIALAIKFNRNVDINEAFQDVAIRNYISAVVATLAATKHRDMDISMVGGSFAVLSSGSLEVEEIIESAKDPKEPVWDEVRESASKYFEINPSD